MADVVSIKLLLRYACKVLRQQIHTYRFLTIEDNKYLISNSRLLFFSFLFRVTSFHGGHQPVTLSICPLAAQFSRENNCHHLVAKRLTQWQPEIGFSHTVKKSSLIWIIYEMEFGQNGRYWACAKDLVSMK